MRRRASHRHIAVPALAPRGIAMAVVEGREVTLRSVVQVPESGYGPVGGDRQLLARPVSAPAEGETPCVE